MAQGFTRFRRIQVGKQSVIDTAVPATRVLPYRGALVVNPNRTDPDVDVGSIDPIMAPYPTALSVTMGGATGPLTFDDLAIRHSAGIMGGITATGSAVAGYTWTFQAASLTANVFDYYSVQTADDTGASGGSGILGFGGVINQMSMSMPQDLGPWTVSDDWICAGAVFGNYTAGLTVDANPKFAFGADTVIYLDTVAGAIGTSPIVNALRAAQLTVNNNLDEKRYANGSNTRFALSDYGRGQRTIELQATVEKTAAMITEANTIANTPTPNRYLKVAVSSTENAGSGGTKCSANIFLPMRLFSVTEGEIGGNANYQLTYRGFYDATLTYAYKAVIVNSLSVLP